ncbi:MAG: hypothetical protein PHN53_11375, partial [Eubacteriales bacterium]|nr:hypothetical protein [Eubacteriales bacterium]
GYRDAEEQDHPVQAVTVPAVRADKDHQEKPPYRRICASVAGMGPMDSSTKMARLAIKETTRIWFMYLANAGGI